MIREVSLAIVVLALMALTSFGSMQSACAADTLSSMPASQHFDADAATAA